MITRQRSQVTLTVESTAGTHTMTEFGQGAEEALGTEIKSIHHRSGGNDAEKNALGIGGRPKARETRFESLAFFVFFAGGEGFVVERHSVLR